MPEDAPSLMSEAGRQAPSPGRPFGDYELLGEIARGGMGVVYKARQVRLNRVVALKMILDGALSSDTALRRFRSEAQTAASLQHPNIVAIHEVGEHEERQFYSMDYIEGRSLAAVIGGRPLPPDQAARLLLTTAEAVHHAHLRGVLHRDLKPANILIDARGQPHVADFGLAKQVGCESSLTLTGIVVGSPGYMSPEQLRGDKGAVDARSDVYALGATLYEALTGRSPFLAATVMETMRQVEVEEPIPPQLLNPAVPSDLQTICLKCLEKSPRTRYASAGELADDLRRFLNREPILAWPAGPWEKAVKWARRRPAVAALIGVSVFAMLSLLVGGAWYNVQLRAEAERARLAEAEARTRQSEAETSRAAANHNLAYAQLAQAGMFLDDGRIMEARSLYARSRDLLWKLDASDFPVTVGMAGSYALSPPALLTFTGHTNGVFGVAFSRDGKQALSGSYDHGMILWELKTGRRVRTFKGHKAVVYSVAFSPDGRRVLSGSGDGTAKLWETDTGREVWTLQEREGRVRSVAFAPDGRQAVTISGHALAVWDLQTGRLVRTFGWEEKNSDICGIAVSADGTYALSAANQDQGITDNAVILWELATGRDLRHFKGHLAFSAALSPDGQFAASGSIDKTISLWDIATGKEVRAFVGHRNPVQDIAFSPDGRRLLSGGRERNVRLWDVATGREVRSFTGHSADAYGVAYSPDGRWALSGSLDRTAKLWAVEPAQEVRAFAGHTAGVNAVRFTSDGRLAVSAGRDGTVRVWDVATGHELRRFTLGGDVTSLSLPADGKSVLVTRYSTFKLLSLETGQELLSIPGKYFQVAISPDGRRALTGCYVGGGQLTLWDVATGEKLREMSDDTVQTVNGIAFLPDGKQAITASGDSAVILWDLDTGQRVRDFLGHTSRAISLDVSRDGAYVLSGGWDCTLRLWAVASGRSVRTFHGHEGHIYSAALSPDGRWALSGGADDTVRLWDVQTGEEIRTLACGGERFDTVAFAPDGMAALAGNPETGTLRYWDFRRPALYQKYEPRVAEAQDRLTKDARDAGALKALGEYYAFRGVDDWAVELLERAREGGAEVFPLMLARCCWRLSRDASVADASARERCRSAAAAEFQRELDRVKALPAAADSGAALARGQELLYLTLCLQAVSAPKHEAGPEQAP